MNRRELILEVGAEGGSITLYGTRTTEGWRFSRNVMDQTPELLDEPWIEHDSDTIKSWPAALKLLDTYPWHHLVPLQVHAEFRDLVFKAVTARYKARRRSGPDRRSEWKELCGVARG